LPLEFPTNKDYLSAANASFCPLLVAERAKREEGGNLVKMIPQLASFCGSMSMLLQLDQGNSKSALTVPGMPSLNALCQVASGRQSDVVESNSAPEKAQDAVAITGDKSGFGAESFGAH
jgi:hypothetical protein